MSIFVNSYLSLLLHVNPRSSLLIHVNLLSITLIVVHFIDSGFMKTALAFISILTVVSALGNLTAEEESGSKTREKKGNSDSIDLRLG
jgi:hypothetical protein